jgi:hypothetical protein
MRRHLAHAASTSFFVAPTADRLAGLTKNKFPSSFPFPSFSFSLSSISSCLLSYREMFQHHPSYFGKEDLRDLLAKYQVVDVKFTH